MYNPQGYQADKLYARALARISRFPLNALTRARLAVKLGTLNVTFWGNSITEGSDQIYDSDPYANRLRDAIREALPGVTTNNFNRALGSRTIAQANNVNYKAVGTTDPGDLTTGFGRSWSTVNGQSWRDYVKNTAPDLLILCWGMNDTVTNEQTFYTNLTTMINDAKTWNPVPSIIVCTEHLPTTNPARYGQPQVITQALARIAREYSGNNGIICADANRLFRILRDGLDDVERQGTKETDWATVAGNRGDGIYPGGWTSSTGSWTYAGGVFTSVAGKGDYFVYRNRTFYNGSITVTVNIPAGSNVYIDLRRDAAFTLGKVSLIVLPNSAGANTGQLNLYSGGTLMGSVSNADIPAATDRTVMVFVRGAMYQVLLGGVMQFSVFDYTCMHDGMVGFGTDQPTNRPTISNVSLVYADPLQTSPLYLEDDVLGLYNTAPKLTTGNGINHPSSLGHSLFFMAAFEGILRALADSSPIKLTSSAVVNPGAIAASASATAAIPVTGARVGDAVSIAPPAAVEAGLNWSAVVTANDTVTLRVYNTTNAAITPASATWAATIVK